VNKDGVEVFVNGTSVGTSPISGELFANRRDHDRAKAEGRRQEHDHLDKGGARLVKLTLGEGAGGNGQEPNGHNGDNGSDTPSTN
jgi:hypothetical protein